MLQLGRQVLRYVKVELPSSPLVEVHLVLAGQHYKSVVPRIEVKAQKECFLVLSSVPREYKLHAAINVGFIIFKLIEQLISREEGNCFCVVAECGFGYVLKPIKNDSVEYVEAITAFIPDLGKG